MAKTHELQVTNHILRFGHEVYHISNLVRVGKYKVKKRKGALVFLLIVAAAGTWAAVAQKSELAILGIIAILVILAILIFRRSDYALRIETNSGSANLFSTKKERVVDELVDLISEVWQNQERSVNYMVNLSDHSVHEHVMGDKFTNIRDAVVATRSSVATGGRHG